MAQKWRYPHNSDSLLDILVKGIIQDTCYRYDIGLMAREDTLPCVSVSSELEQTEASFGFYRGWGGQHGLSGRI